MTTFASHTGRLTAHALRRLSRQPAYLLFNLIQPMVWLLLFGELFRRVAELPGFGTGDYLSYLTPGVVVMTAMMSAGWAGTSFIDDMDRGVMDRNLTSPVSRGALIAGSLAHQSVVTAIQSLIVFGVGLLAGARYDGGVLGVLVVLAVAVLLSIVFSALSDAIALLVRQQEALIGVSQFLALPLAFLSSVMMAPSLLPGWVGTVAEYNPVDWAAVAGREALTADPDWARVLGHGGLLLALAAVMSWLATRAFRAYQRAN
ncbi:ABC transporter permease [Amycolatopsis sp. 195334CR]|uniref:ABC transporter permease n=1 Tax=Amycolatopsis sp. 195334CR TaxID=2814588 RepID=UPI001A8D908A|nr:ABC transporter permease [Amycolatopsis sp. 195334CR]MBN6033812.1 ABC transporter permease [Amycolatopsis sp. 195334CR]